jgi:tRNA G10  N-methylase Trm11
MKVKYAFNLGRVFTLSLAELFGVFENMGLSFRLVDLYREVLVIETEEVLPVEKLQKRLGGTIKIMEVLDSLGRKKMDGPSWVFKDYFDVPLLKEKFLGNATGKIQIGVSIYPMARELPLRGEPKRLGLGIKDLLTTAGWSVRAVLPQEEAIALPSVVVTGEHLLTKGAEIDFLVGAERIYLAKTLSVQDFEDYGRRDYQRPARDNQVGMLPPKVAQIMLNLAQLPVEMVGDLKRAVLDPFVGSGTVLQEAMLMGYKGIGSDISQKAVDDGEKNLQWVKNRYKLPTGRYELFLSDVKELQTNLPKLKFEAIVTEGTLGPAYAQMPNENEIKQNFKNLQTLYLGAFKAFAKILSSGKRVVIALPAYRTTSGYRFLEIVDKLSKLGYDIVDPLPEVLIEKYDFLRLTQRKSIIYDRKDQFVSREIFIFKVQ